MALIHSRKGKVHTLGPRIGEQSRDADRKTTNEKKKNETPNNKKVPD
jgi:hypothetical protein